ncbi:hypothetical protein FRC06_000223 [Ceratobasidium sp. 370]|nr:hypothetical protein FRC06_000223 [Ceratobasidium sp. 370]
MVTYKILVGAYSSVITILSFTPASSNLAITGSSYAGSSPSWITTHPTNKSVLFATQENPTGALWSFAIGSQGQLTQGSDKVWRLTKSSSGALQNSGYIQQPAGSGPRHGVVKGNTLYVLHELSNTLTQQTIPPLGWYTQPPVTASVSIVPSDSPNPSVLGAGELLLSPATSAFPTQYLYATNRGEASDAITIVSIANGTLTIVKQVRTGVSVPRGAALSPDGLYLIVGGQNSNDAVVFQRINGGADLKEIARVTGVTSPTSFVWL